MIYCCALNLVSRTDILQITIQYRLEKYKHRNCILATDHLIKQQPNILITTVTCVTLHHVLISDQRILGIKTLYSQFLFIASRKSNCINVMAMLKDARSELLQIIHLHIFKCIFSNINFNAQMNFYAGCWLLISWRSITHIVIINFHITRISSN